MLIIGTPSNSYGIVTGATVVKTDISCSGASDGSAYVDGSSITSTNPGATFTFFWQGGNIPGTSTADTVKNLVASNYVVRIRDNVDGTISIPFFFTVSSPNPLIPLLIPMDVSCFGVCDGEIEAFMFGGTAPFTYLWDDPANSTTAKITGLCARTYNVTVTDAGGCSAVDFADVNSNPQIDPNVSTTDVACFGDATGTAIAAPIGGTGVFAANSYTWSSSGNNTDTETGLTAGNYFVTVVDSDGCTEVEAFTIGQPAAALAVSLNKSDAFCFGVANGSISTTPSGGTSPYTFTWADGPLTQNRNNILAGTYFVTVEDNNGCSVTDNVTVSEPTDITAVFGTTDVSCNGGNDGLIHVTASGGANGAKTFDWSTGQSNTDNTAPFSDTLKNLAIGKYFVTITNVAGCTKVDSAEIFEPTPLVPSFTVETPPSCNGGSDGTITAAAIGGTAPYTFNWSNGTNNNPTIAGLNAGSYTVTVIDNQGCSISLTSTLADPAPIVPNLVATDVLCFGDCSGSITAAPSGGNAPYTYAWSSGGTAITEPNLCAGSYTVTVRDAGNCSSTQTISVGQPANPLAVSLSKSDAFCFGTATGSITTTPSGGTIPYTFSWNDGSSSQNRPNLLAGTYSVTVFDNNNCSETASITIGEPSDISTSFVVDSVSCNGLSDGVINVTATGGVAGAITFNWSTGANNTDNTSPFTSSITALSAGKYFVTITNVAGCAKVDSAEVFEPLPLAVIIDSQSDPLCNGASDGTINITASGGTMPYTYGWSDGSSDENRTGLASGAYTVTVTDNNGCTIGISTTLTDPPALTAAIDSTRDESCVGLNDGFARVLPGGGTAPYTFAWPGGITTPANSNLAAGTYTVTVFDDNNCSTTATATINAAVAITASINGSDATCSGINDGSATASAVGGVTPYTFTWGPGGQTTQTIGSLAAGVYTVTVEDANGCTDDETITINQPAAITFTTSKTDVLCNGDATGVATVSPNGGTLPYTYIWSPGGGNTASINGLTAQTYDVTVSDANGCSNDTSVTILEPSALTATITSTTDPTCNGVADGSVTVTAAGGPLGGTYTYLWAPDGETTPTINSKIGGVYSVTVTDDNNCTATAQTTLVNPPSVIITVDSISDVSCFGGMDGYIEISGSGGAIPYTFNWNNGAGNVNINNNLIAGSYDVTVSDNNGCFVTQSFTINQPATGLGASTVTTDILCEGDDDGTATITVSGGTIPYTYNWPGGLTGPSNINLDGGNYDVTIFDDNGCSIIESFTIAEPNPLIVSIASTDVTCNGANDGTATASAVGGTSPYTFDWTPTASGPNQTGLAPGNYTVTVTDGNSCTDSASVTITQANSLGFTVLQSTDVTCFGADDGVLEVTGLGGTPGYTYAWSNGPSTQLNAGLSPGNYDLTISDAAGCTVVFNGSIAQPTQLTVALNIDKAPCAGSSDGELTANEAGGTAPYTYAWTGTTQTTKTVNGLSAGLVSVTVTDANSCTATDQVILTPSAPILIFGASSADITCFGANDGTAVILAGGGTGTLTYTWNDGNSQFLRTGLSQGTYTVSVFDANGCFESRTLTVNEPALLDPGFSKQDASCSGGAAGSASSTPIGGTSPYDFEWSTGQLANGLTSSITGLASGNYSLTVTDANACDTVTNFSIAAGVASFTFTDTVADAACNGNCDGFIEIRNFAGGTAPYTYSWSNGVNGPTNPGLCPGPYDVTIQDDNGCDTVQTYTIGTPSNLFATITTTNDTCIQGIGTATVTNVTGGTAPYTFLWSAGIPSGNTTTGLPAGTYDVTIEDANLCSLVEPFTINNISTFSIVPTVTDVSCKNLSDGQIDISTLGGVNPVTYNWNNGLVGANPSGLIAGFYDITVTDALGCAELQTIEVKEPDSLLATIATVDESCLPGTDGTATANVSGGTAPYTFNWSGGTPSGNGTTGLTAGLYGVTITDNNGCQFDDQFRIFNTAPFSVSFNVVDESCDAGMNGEVQSTVTGAVPPLTFNWTGGLTGPNITGLSLGTYLVTITDATTCSRTTAVSVGRDASITAVVTATDESCSPGMDAYAIAVPTGGIAPYTYTWSAGTPFNDSVADLSAGGYSVLIEDAIGCTQIETFSVSSGSDIDGGEAIVDVSCFGVCDGEISLNPSGGTGAGYSFSWRDGSTDQNRINLCAGSYLVTISDNATPPCSKVLSYSVGSPSEIEITGVFTNSESCNPGGNGGVTLFISGGTSPYTVASPAGNVVGNNIANLSAGTYITTITDANSCFITRSVTVNVSQPPTLAISTTDATCNGGNDGSITVISTGGVNPLTYNWTGGLAGANPTGVSAGKYFVSVIDNKGCVAIDSAEVGEGVQITSTLTTTGESCTPGVDGTVTASGTAGGTAPYTYDWGAGNTSVPSNTGLVAGPYDVTVSDAIGCTEVIPYIINSDAPFTLTSGVFNVSCNGLSDGFINLTITGATGPLIYNWDNGLPATEDQSTLLGGIYSVTITDQATGCTETDQFTVIDPPVITIAAVITPESCTPGLDGTISLSPSGGTTANPGIYSYAWDNGLPATKDQVGLTAGAYTVTVTDDNACTATRTLNVIGSPRFTLDLDSTDVICNGANNGSITTTTDANSPVFVWDNGLPSQQNQNNLGPGIYSVTVTDGITGCTETASISINEPTLIVGTVVPVDATCAGGTDGSASVSATGGFVRTPGVYIFSWSNGQTGLNVTGLSPGAYDVSIFDDNGCRQIVPFSIGTGSPFTIQLDSTDVSCNGGTDGEIRLSTTAIGPLFDWSGSLPTTQNQLNLAAGTYRVTVTEPSSGCTAVDSIQVNEPSLIVGTINTTPESCTPGNDGAASATAIGGTVAGNHTFNWSTGASGNSISGLTAGSYDVSIFDDNNCSVVVPFIINADAPFTLAIDTTDITCNGLTDGEIDLTVTGATGTLLYAWDNSLPAQEDQSNLGAGIYGVTITDQGSGCTETATIPIVEPALIVPTVVAVDATCNPGNDGTASVTAVGGTVAANYTFNWSTGVSGPSISGLGAGNYDVTVIDDNNCQVIELFSIAGSALFSLDLDSTDLSCNGDLSGTIITTTDAVNPVFAWSNGLPATKDQSNLSGGTYTVTVTEPSTGCTKSASIVVNEPAALVLTVNKTDESCSVGNDGTASASAIGGTATAGYTFDWSTGVQSVSISGLSAGNYDVTVTDDNGCTEVNAFSINSATPIIPNEVVVDETCGGVCDGSITLSPTGGDGNYTYSWNTGETTRTRTNLCGGTYDVTIQDGSGCDTTLSLTINSNAPITASISTQDQSCSSSTVCDGGAVATVSGGLAPYTYDWSMGINTGLGPDTAINLCIGSYNVTITDANGCFIIENFDINGPAPIVPNFSTTNPTCNLCNGLVSVSPSGGTGNYTYEWYDASLTPLGNQTDNINSICSGIYFIDITDDSGCSGRFSIGVSDNGAEAISIAQTDVSCFGTCDGQAVANFICLDPACQIEWFNATTGISLGITADTAKNLCAGDYFVQVTNNSGCIALEPVTIGSPNSFIVSSSITDVTCFGGLDGAIDLTVSGGTGNYSFIWAPGPLNGQNSANISGLQMGTYSLTLSDGNLCDTVLSFVVGEPAEITASFTTADANCGVADGIINASVSGGTIAADYNYQWLDASSNPIAGAINPSLLNVIAGNYFLRVQDDLGCEKTFLATLGNTNAPTVVIDSTDDNACFADNNGAVYISVSGSNGPFTYNWIPGGQTSQNIFNLTSGTYIVGVTNALGCISYDTAIVNGPTEIMATFTPLDATCGLCNGEASISVSGGTAPYTYLWSNGSTADSADSLCAGVYTSVVIDANGCSKSFDVTINASGGPSGANISTTAASCASSCDGTATVNATGGTGPYTYNWLHNGSSSNSQSGLCRGDYLLLITDRRGCSRNITVTISSPAVLDMTTQITAHTCNSIPCDGAIRLDVTGGTTPYTYAWGPSPLSNSNVQNGLCSGIYQVTVNDANGCSMIRSITLPNSADTIVANPSVADVSCFNTCDGSLISNLPLSSDYDFQWFNDQGTALSALNSDLINTVCIGDYYLEITSNPSGCKSYVQANVAGPDSILLGSSVVNNISCNGECDGEIFISTSGGNILYSYSWDDPNNQDGVRATDLCAGVYGVTATDANGCSATTQVTLVDPPVLSITINSQVDLTCSSVCDGSANVSPSGGVSPYVFNWSGGQIGTSPSGLCFGANVVTMTDATGCSVSDTVFIGATDTVVAIVPNDPIICGGEGIRLLGDTMGSSITSVAWYQGNTSNFFSNNLDTTITRNFGSYVFYLIASNGTCADTAEYSFTVVPNPSVGLAPSVTIFRDEIAQILLSGKDPTYAYDWTPGIYLSDSTIAEPTAQPPNTITYTLLVTDTNTCTYTDSIQVIYQPEFKIPSGISPNGDGKNDLWEIDFLEEFPDAKVYIYNRWGTLIYSQTNGYNVSWDGTFEGKALPIGTYYYVIDLMSDRFDPFTGPITIVK